MNYTFLEYNFDGKSKECDKLTNNNTSVLNENRLQIISNVANEGFDNFEINVDDGHSAEIETHTNNNISYQVLQENVQQTASNIKNKECQNSKVNNFDEHLKINNSTCPLLVESVEHTVSSVINAGSSSSEVNKENVQKEEQG